MNNDDQRLDQLLRQWRCPVEGNSGLGAEVWRRIEAREESPWTGRNLIAGWFGRPLAGPALAASLFLAAVAGGIGFAELRVQSAREFASVQNPEQAYFQSINPVALARHGHHR